MKKLTLILALLMATTTMFAGESIIFQETTKEVVKIDTEEGIIFDITFKSGRLGNFETIKITPELLKEINTTGKSMTSKTTVTLSSGVELSKDQNGFFSLEENGHSVQLTSKMFKAMKKSLK